MGKKLRIDNAKLQEVLSRAPIAKRLAKKVLQSPATIKNVKLLIKCPECQKPLFSHPLAKHLAWCQNSQCPLYIRRTGPGSLVFDAGEESFL
jgi:acetyl-CoA carboxylase beta subunit